MSANRMSIINLINFKCDNNDFASARKLLEKNINTIYEGIGYRHLNDNARALAEHIMSEMNHDRPPFDHEELLTINHINRCSSAFDIPMLKRIIKNSSELLSKPSIIPLLNKDAHYLLKTMGVPFSTTNCQKTNLSRCNRL